MEKEERGKNYGEEIGTKMKVISEQARPFLGPKNMAPKSSCRKSLSGVKYIGGLANAAGHTGKLRSRSRR